VSSAAMPGKALCRLHGHAADRVVTQCCATSNTSGWIRTVLQLQCDGVADLRSSPAGTARHHRPDHLNHSALCHSYLGSQRPIAARVEESEGHVSRRAYYSLLPARYSCRSAVSVYLANLRPPFGRRRYDSSTPRLFAGRGVEESEDTACDRPFLRPTPCRSTVIYLRLSASICGFAVRPPLPLRLFDSSTLRLRYAVASLVPQSLPAPA